MKKINYFLVFVLLLGVTGPAAAENDWSGAFVTTTIDRVVCATAEGYDCPDEVIIQKRIVLPGVNSTNSRIINIESKRIETGVSGSNPVKVEPSQPGVILPKGSSNDDSKNNVIAEIQKRIAEEKDSAAISALQKKLVDLMGGNKNSNNPDKDPAQQKRIIEEQYVTEKQKRAIEEGGTAEVIKEKKGVWGVINNITNPAKPAPDWKKQEAEWEAAKAKQAEENRQGLENSKNTPVYEILPDGTQRQVSGPVQAEKRSFLDILKGNPEKFQQEAERKLEALPAEAQARIESIKQEFEAKREEAKASFETQKEVLKEKISAIKDQKKQETVSRLNENINELNKKKTEEFSKVVAKLEGIWASIQNKATQAAANGAEVGFISEAQSQVDSLFSAAKDSLNQQTGKSYELNITTEDNLKTDIGQVRQTLESDLKAVREKIGAIKEMLYKEANQLSQVSMSSVETVQ